MLLRTSPLFVAALSCAMAASTAWPRAAPPVTLAGPPTRILGTIVRAGDASYALAQSGGNTCLPQVFIPFGVDGPHEAGGSPRYAGCGAIVELAAGGNVSNAYLFTPAGGASPQALRASAHGTLVGITALGGRYGRGTVFRFTPDTQRFEVLQDLDDNVDLSYDFPGYDAAFDNGSAVSIDTSYAAVRLLTRGEPARTVHRFPNGTHIGPVAVANDGRAVFTVKLATACDVGIDALAADGTFSVLVSPDAQNAPACSHAPGDVLAVRSTSDGRFVSNDATDVYVASPGGSWSSIFTLTADNAPKGTQFIGDSAVLAADGDPYLATTVTDGCGIVGHVRAGTLVTDATFSGDECLTTDSEQNVALLPANDGITGAVYERFAGGYTFAAPSGKPAVATDFPQPIDVKTIAYVPSIERNDPSGGDDRTSVDWTGYEDLALPDLVVDPKLLDFELQNLTRPDAPSLRLHPANTHVVRSTRTEMTMDRFAKIDVRAALPTHLAPGRYRLTVRAGTALRTATGTQQTIVDDDAPTYFLVTPHDASPSTPDLELQRVRAKYAGKTVTAVRDLPVECQSVADELIPAGTLLRVTNVSRTDGSGGRFFGPLALHDVPPGDIATAYGAFAARTTLTFDLRGIAFADRPDCLVDAVFAADWDAVRYLQP